MPSSGVVRRAPTITEAREFHLRVPRTARYRVLGDPSGAREVWFVLHGYRQLAERFIRRFEGLPGAGGARAVVAPEALSRFYVEEEVGPHGQESRVGASWMTRADREQEIRDYVEYLDRLAGAVLSAAAEPALAEAPNAEPPNAEPLDAGERRVVVLGFSQGAETASRWVTYGRIRADELVLWGGGLASDLDPGSAKEALGRTSVRLMVGTEDRWATGRADETERRMAELGLAAGRTHYVGGHRVLTETLAENWPLENAPPGG